MNSAYDKHQWPNHVVQTKIHREVLKKEKGLTQVVGNRFNAVTCSENGQNTQVMRSILTKSEKLINVRK